MLIEIIMAIVFVIPTGLVTYVIHIAVVVIVVALRVSDLTLRIA